MSPPWFGKGSEKKAQSPVKNGSQPASKTLSAQTKGNSQRTALGSEPSKSQTTAPVATPAAAEHAAGAARLSQSASKPTVAATSQSQTGRGKRRPKNTVVVSLQMPAGLVDVLDDIVETGTYKSRSDLILQAVRSYPNISSRLLKLEPKHAVQKG